MKGGRSCFASWFSEWKNPDTVDFPVAATGKCHDETSGAASVFNPIWTRFSCTCDNGSRTGRDYNAVRTSKNRCYKFTSVLIISFLVFFFLLQFWHHEFLIWDPDECDGVTKISLPVKQLWSPDIIVYELWVSAEQLFFNLFLLLGQEGWSDSLFHPGGLVQNLY